MNRFVEAIGLSDEISPKDLLKEYQSMSMARRRDKIDRAAGQRALEANEIAFPDLYDFPEEQETV